MSQTFLSQMSRAIALLRAEKKREYNRFVPVGDLLTDRSNNAEAYGFGMDTTCYDNVLVIGDVEVGRNVWIGPNVILDGTGGLIIGDYCSISAGVQIYSHDTVAWSTSMGAAAIEVGIKPTRIGSGVYIGPQTVVQKSVEIGDCAIIGANSLVNKSLPAGCRAWGTPARVVEGD